MSGPKDAKATPIKYSEWIITDNDDSVYTLNSETQNLGLNHYFFSLFYN